MKRIRVFTEEMYNEIKNYQRIGLSQRQVRELTGRGQGVISLVFNTSDYSKYREWNVNRTKRLREKKQGIIQKTPIIEVKQEPQDLITILTNIDNRLDRIEETLEAKIAHNKVSWWKN